MIMCCPIAPGPAKWPRRVPPENISEAEVGSSSEMRTSTFRVRSPQQSGRLKISTLWTETEVPKSMANQGVASPSVWQKPPSIVRPSIQLSAPKVWNVDDWVAVTGCSCSPGNCSPVKRICTKQRRWRKWRNESCAIRECWNTWGHSTPVDTPTSPWMMFIGCEQELDDICLACDVGRLRVSRGSRHQGCPIPVCDWQVVPKVKGEHGEVEWQDQTLLYFYRLCLLKIVGIAARVVWRGYNTCCKESFKITPRANLIMFSPPLTSAATALCRAKCWMHWLPKSGSGGQVRSTSHVNVTPAAAALASVSMVVDEDLVRTVQVPGESAGLAKSGRGWVGAHRSWWRY